MIGGMNTYATMAPARPAAATFALVHVFVQQSTNICSATSGKVEYFKKVGDSITASPVISNGSLYILTKNTTRILGYN